mgnify:CR=1 FL=1
MKFLTFEELQALAMKHYHEGGDAFVECWDKEIFDIHVMEYGPMTEETALCLMGIHQDKWDDMQSLARECYDPETDSENENQDFDDFEFEYENEYLSATDRDYSPSCPWNAPGMSISDFI